MPEDFKPTYTKRMFVLGKLSRAQLVGVHPALVKVVERAIQITPIDFFVNDGVRTVTEQRRNVAKGVSKTMRSRHIPQSNRCGMSCAVDLVPWNDVAKRWEFNDWKVYNKFAPYVKAAAKEVGVPITWGGDWTSIKDGPHFELPASFEPYV
jgi:peptidoglycan L-alanyl-D-glutamate endopeptidase CwlK